MISPAFDRFVAPARRYPALWRLVVGLVAGIAVFLAWNGLLFGLLMRGHLAPDAIGAFAGDAGPGSPWSVMILFASFAGMMLAAFAATALHRRGPRSLIGPDLHRAAADFAMTFAVVAAVYAPALALWFLMFDSLPGLDPRIWLALLPLTLLGLLVQTGAEEMMFRGYLTQQLAARFRAPLVWGAVPALAFGLLHFNPAATGATAWMAVAAAAFFGLVATDLTVRAGSLGPAWGFHFANNLAAIALLSTDGTITGIALRTTPYSVDDPQILLPMMAADLAVMALAWAILRRWLGRRSTA